MKTDKERMPIVMRRAGTALLPVSKLDEDMLERYSEGHHIEITIKMRRSLPMQRLYWATLQKVVDATDAYPTAEHLHDAIKMALGYTTEIQLLKGGKIYVPDSTAFGKMDAATFRIFFDRAIELLNKLTGSDVLQEAA
jgi:hypothetical protein